jgi:hypothetical protein
VGKEGNLMSEERRKSHERGKKEISLVRKEGNLMSGERRKSDEQGKKEIS